MAIKAMSLTPRRIRVQEVMGTVVSIDVRDMQVPETAIEAAFAWLRDVDGRFSPYYKPESEISRLGRGELTVGDCHPDVARVVDLCEQLRHESRGAFNAWKARPDGRFDPSGVVKGWAVQRAADLLEEAGARNFFINAGGDVVAHGVAEPGRSWRVGIRHPHDPHAVAVVVEITNLALATSGNYERGDHVLDARTGLPARGLLSLSVAGPSLTLADAYATAGFAMGPAGVGWAAARPGYAALGITDQGRVRYSDGFAGLIAAKLHGSAGTEEEGVDSPEERASPQAHAVHSHDGGRIRGAQN